MYLLIKLIFVISVILSILLILVNLMSKKTFYDREKNSPFECGFDPISSSRLPFSLHFFLIAIIFLIFDIEIVLLLPLILTLKLSNLFLYSFIVIFFIGILIIGLAHEWAQGALEWMK
uniref:NADH dehydrogenase subunit 3 n=1 Tax=Phyllotreta striolata TaxID=444603 RepID=UPI0013B42B8F|nr:NADH dehydrogenase subunit 3 [Phyllotreta striolata]QHR79687.1 NADH dehydrogenase subunit 3 [Phyllotreta striolata]UPE50057.1 NADH dehydrogenase subunit 3 [Phyllotreta striolata]WDV10358.1 NADH dehydrogenase subunit 3 [Phyllotreta striolata]